MRYNPYEVLGVPDLSDVSVVVKTWKKKASSLHPDRGGDAEEFIRMRRAVDELTDAEFKQKIDSMILGIPVRNKVTAMQKAVDSLLYSILESVQ